MSYIIDRMSRRFQFSFRALQVVMLIGCLVGLSLPASGQTPKPRATIAGGDASRYPTFTPDGKMLLECSMGGLGDFTELWDVKTGQRLGRLEHPNVESRGSSTIHPIALAADSKRMAIDLSRWIEIWDVATMNRVVNVDSEKLHIDSLSFSPDGSVLAGLQHGATGWHGSRQDTQLCCWDAFTGAEIMSFKPAPDEFMEIAFGADGKSLLTVTAHEIKRWSLRTGENDSTIVLDNKNAENDEFSFFAFTADRRYLVSAQSGEDRFSRSTPRCLWRVRLWDAATGRRLADFPVRRGDRFEPKSLSPDGRTLAVGSDTGILLYRFGSYLDAPEEHADDSAVPDAPSVLKCRRGQIWSLAFSPNGKTLASTWAFDADIKIWDVETGRNIYTLKNQKFPSKVGFSADGKTFASKDKHHVIRLWDWP